MDAQTFLFFFSRSEKILKMLPLIKKKKKHYLNSEQTMGLDQYNAGDSLWHRPVTVLWRAKMGTSFRLRLGVREVRKVPQGGDS